MKIEKQNSKKKRGKGGVTKKNDFLSDENDEFLNFNKNISQQG
jgi:hypothetical protein